MTAKNDNIFLIDLYAETGPELSVQKSEKWPDI
jgi:hypothetical protein